MNNIKNKRGDITIAILVIGIVVVCFIALLSFYIAKLDTDKNFNGIGKITQLVLIWKDIFLEMKKLKNK